MIYNWKKIFFLVVLVLFALIIINIILQQFGWPGITGGFAGGIAGAFIAIMIQREPYLKIEAAKPLKTRKKRRN